MANVLEIEIDGPQNEALQFRPLQRRVRGRFDFTRGGVDLYAVGAEWPGPVPGQKLGIDLDRGVGYVVDPLHDPANVVFKERIEKKGWTLPPAREEFPGACKASWLYWLANAVRCGLARVVSGKLPEASETEGARKDFIFAPKPPSTNERLIAALERNTAAFEKFLNAIAAKSKG